MAAAEDSTTASAGPNRNHQLRRRDRIISVLQRCRHVSSYRPGDPHKAITVSQTMIEALKTWKQTTQFSTQEDWIFASPAQLGRLPWSADSVNDAYQKAASSAGIAHVSTHSMRHTYRSWLDAVGTPIAVQQKLMRHADIRTTMNTYGDVVTDEMSRAASKVAGLALNGM
jgi:integrase